MKHYLKNKFLTEFKLLSYYLNLEMKWCSFKINSEHLNTYNQV